MVIANIFPTHKIKVALMVLVAAVAEGLNNCQEENLPGEENQRGDREATGPNRLVNSAKYSGAGPSCYKKDIF